MYSSIYVKFYETFMPALHINKMNVLQFSDFLIKFRYYYHYFITQLRVEVQIIFRKHL
jgi:hypothetical protein